jgi:hypothetical protein
MTSCWYAKPNDTQQSPRPPLDLPILPPIESKRVDFIIITDENYEQVFNDMKANGLDPVIFGMSDIMYEVNATNYQNAIMRIFVLRRQIEDYRNYYEVKASDE